MHQRRIFAAPRQVVCIQLRLALAVFGLAITIGFAIRPIRAQAIPTPFEQAAAQAFNPNNKTFSAITITGSATWIAGSLTETGAVTFQISSNGSFTETWNLPTQSHTYQSLMESGVRSCTYTDSTGKQTVITDLSCLQTVPWFAPWFGLSSIASGFAMVTDSTQSSDTANGIERLSFVPNVSVPGGMVAPTGQPVNMFQQATLMTVAYDRKSSTPTSARFDQSIDTNFTHTIQREATYTDYRSESGYVFPHHIQRFIQRTLQADITVDSVNAQ